MSFYCSSDGKNKMPEKCQHQSQSAKQCPTERCLVVDETRLITFMTFVYVKTWHSVPIPFTRNNLLMEKAMANAIHV